jgi:hypothetical protein
MKNLFSLAINGEVVAENMKIGFAVSIILALLISDHFKDNLSEITIQRVSENDE